MKRIYSILFLLPVIWLCSCATKKVAPNPNVSSHVICYRSVDQFGEPIMLSGKMSYPTDKTPKGMMLLAHGTYIGNHEVPSGKPMYEERFFADDYVLVMPDYMGYGITKDSIHPYLCGELTAQHCADMILRVREITDSMHIAMHTDSITIVGYSQGGATALWTLKVLEERYAAQIPVKACYAGSGPYDVASEFDVSLMKNKVNIPITIPMLVMGTNAGYHLHLQPEDFFTKATIKMYEKYILPKDKGLFEAWFHTQNHRLSHWLSAAGRDKSQPATQQIYEGLLRSCLVHYPLDNHLLGQDSICSSWRPKAQTYIFHSTNDDGVGFFNSEHLRRCWGELPNVTYDFGRYGGHLKAFYLFAPRIAEIINEKQEQ